ncbi:MAG: tetratricopeptide repeat protein [Dehalococcoidia bacterium]|nr:tetratricopeptide repeat protein [Dehalococcoidia bacterium]
MPAAVIDSTDATFVLDVIEASRKAPVVVDFWAPWCGPCQALGPTLERVAAETGVTLVKVNTDENPQVAQAFQIQSIPAVKAFKDGRVVDEFLGAQPEPEVRRFFAALAPSEADHLAEQGADALRASDLAAARTAFEAALALDHTHARATGGLAAVCIEEGDLDAAEELVARVPAAPQVKRQAARIRYERGILASDGSVTEPDALAARLEADAEDVEAHYRLGCHHGRRMDFAPALSHFLEVVRLDRAFESDAGREAMLQIFDLLGDEHPLTQEYRPQLSSLLF